MVSGHMIGVPTRATCPNPCLTPYSHPNPSPSPWPEPGDQPDRAQGVSRGGQGHGRDPQAGLPLRPRTQVHQGAARHRLWPKSQNPITLTRTLTLSQVDHATGWLKSIAKDVWPPPVPSSALTNSRWPHHNRDPNPNQVPSAGRKNIENKLNAKAPPRGHLMLLSSDAAAARGPTRPSLRRPRANALVPTAAEL